MTRDPRLHVLLLVMVLVGVLLEATPLSRTPSYVIATMIYLCVLGVAYHRGTLAVRYDPFIVVPTVLLWAVFLIAYVRNPTGSATLRAGGYIGFSTLNLFVIPATFTREEFADALSVVATAFALVAVPVAIPALALHIGNFGVAGEGANVVLTSVFANQNYLSALSAFGIIALFGTMRSGRRKQWAVLGLAICLLGLVASGGRAALLGAVAGFVLILAYELVGSWSVLPIVVVGVIAGVGVVLIAVSGVLGARTAEALFTHRAALWQAALRAIADRPLLGWGLVDDGPILLGHGGPQPAGNVFSVHNSYLRMFLMTGIVGGVLYLTLCAGAVIRGVQLATNPTKTVRCFPIALLIAVLILGLFSNSPIFGLSFTSVLGALAFGFASRESYTVRIRHSWISSRSLGQLRQSVF